jgi:citrate synthase
VPGRRLTTAEAAARLGVKPATLYAYVSRGVLDRRREGSGSSFDAAEIDRLALRARRPAERRAQPVAFVTELTLVDGDNLRYRGLDVVGLSRERSFEEVAGWLWAGRWPDPAERWAPTQEVAAVVAATTGALPATSTLSDRCKVAAAAAATADPLRHDLEPTAVAATAKGLIAAMVGALPVVQSGSAGASGVAGHLWARLTPRPGPWAEVLDAALVLLADHEMAASTVAARTAAMVGADPYAVVGAGLGAASGPYHAATSVEVVRLLARAARLGPAVAFGEILGQGRRIPGFGHALYPSGDRRGAELLARLDRWRPPNAEPDAVDQVLELARSRGMPPPNIDLALGALAHRAGMVEGAGEAIFVLARTAGWIAHAIEEYQSRSWLRVRATYVGPRDDEPDLRPGRNTISGGESR